MTAERARVKQVFAAALEVDLGARADFVRTACAGDPALYREVTSLLGFHDDRELITAPPAPPAADEPPPADPLALEGRLLDGRYRVERFVAEGGFGYVFRAHDASNDQPVALKIFKPLGDADARAELERAFAREAALLDRLSRQCPTIAGCHGVGRWTPARGEPLLYTVLEWIDGVPLGAAAAPAGGWRLPELIALLAPIARALATAHEAGVAHRDIKPANILVTADGRPRLLDFGIAKVADERQRGFLSTGGAVTAFSVDYAAPEQLQGHATGPWTDVYALATVMVELLAGRHPYRGESAMRSMLALCDPVNRPTPRALGVAIDDRSEAVFRRALAVDRGERHADVSELWAALTTA